MTLYEVMQNGKQTIGHQSEMVQRSRYLRGVCPKNVLEIVHEKVKIKDDKRPVSNVGFIESRCPDLRYISRRRKRNGKEISTVAGK